MYADMSIAARAALIWLGRESENTVNFSLCFELASLFDVWRTARTNTEAMQLWYIIIYMLSVLL